jgi:outer membrane protein assembly factor BamB
MVGDLVTTKYVRTVKKEIMQFGCFLDQKGEFFDTVNFPPVLKEISLYRAGCLPYRGRVTEEFDFPSVEVRKMARLPGPEFHVSYPGSRSTPLVVKDLLYLVSGLGKIMCLEADTGKEIWSKHAVTDFGGSNIRWGITENLLIDGDKIFFTAGGKKHSILALNRFTGDIVWSASGTGKGDLSAYCSPLIIDLPARKLLVTHMANDIVALDAGTGQFLWSHPFTNRNFIHANTPVYKDGYLYVFSTDESGSLKLDLSSDGSRIGVIWENKEVRNLHGGAIILDDHIYTPSYVNRRWYSIDRTSGHPTYSSREIDRGVVIYADGKLYCYSEKGELALVRPNPQKFEIISKTIIEAGTGEHFSHPVVHKGKLYVRRGDALIVFNVHDRSL